MWPSGCFPGTRGFYDRSHTKTQIYKRRIQIIIKLLFLRRQIAETKSERLQDLQAFWTHLCAQETSKTTARATL